MPSLCALKQLMTL
uniref:Uncharacterized protein n=1 Tax=Musa acuminata subsp. malaccensis TaxID=214687 RepID=A0A804HVZ8_MUSAM